ncbi:hypothetical protein PAMP_001967 [Pampus punctatissimus]
MNYFILYGADFRAYTCVLPPAWVESFHTVCRVDTCSPDPLNMTSECAADIKLCI